MRDSNWARIGGSRSLRELHLNPKHWACPKNLAKGSSIDRSFTLTVFNKLRSSGCR